MPIVVFLINRQSVIGGIPKAFEYYPVFVLCSDERPVVVLSLYLKTMCTHPVSKLHVTNKSSSKRFQSRANLVCFCVTERLTLYSEVQGSKLARANVFLPRAR